MRTLPLALALLATGLATSSAVLAMQEASQAQPALTKPHCSDWGQMLVANP